MSSLMFAPDALLKAQTWTVSGRVIDSVSGNPLAFVSIIVNNGLQGGRTDIDGVFSFKNNAEPKWLNLSYVGYKPLIFPLNGYCSNLEIRMASANNELSEVVIVPGENPAHRIIKKAIENRKNNDPEQMKSFRYQSYNKITIDWYFNEKYYQAAEIWNNDSTKADSSLLSLKNRAYKQHVMMMESFSERIFLFPGKSKETVLGTRVSGFKDPNFASLATDIQPFSFYSDLVSLQLTGTSDYLNPVGNGAIGRYSYLIEDTLYENKDSVYIISFHPMKGKTFNGLKGVVYINTNGYAIQNVIAEPADYGVWKIKIQQQYRFIEGKQWFPEQLNYDWIIPEYPSKKVGIMLKGRSYINPVELDPLLDSKDFGPDKVLMADSAGKRDAVFWNTNRNDTLSKKEIVTYVYMDSLGREINFDYYTRLAPAIMEGFFPIGPIDISYDKIYDYNKTEGHRFGLGLRTGEKIARWFNIGGYFGYGLADKQWKYGGELNIKLCRRHDIEWYCRYHYDLEEPGTSNLYKYPNSAYWLGMMGLQHDMTTHYETGFRFRTFRFLEAEISAHRSTVNPSYNYSYYFGNGESDTSFIFSEARLGLRYAIRDDVTEIFGRRFSMGTRFPVFYLSYTYGIPGTLGGEYEYSRIEAAITKRFRIRNLGYTTLTAEGGLVIGNIPYSRLFRGKGSYSGDVSFLIHNSFQTMRTDEFASNRFVSFFFRHQFGRLLFTAKKFKPEFSIVHNLTFGDLSNSEYHQNLQLKAPSKGYFEAGLIIDNIIRLNILRIAYVGIGGGVFYRYGAYSYEKAFKNFAFKISFSIRGN